MTNKGGLRSANVTNGVFDPPLLAKVFPPADVPNSLDRRVGRSAHKRAAMMKAS